MSGRGARNDTRAVKVITPQRPQTVGVRRGRAAKARPHTALGLRRGVGHHDLFDSRAADTGWGIDNNTINLAERPPSAPPRTEWGHWTNVNEGHGVNEILSARTLHCESNAEIDTDEKNEKDADKNLVQVASLEKGGVVRLIGVQGEDPLCLGRTLLAEAKILVRTNISNNSSVRKSSSRINLKCFSLDGLLRQRRRLQRTLRGFIIQARLLSSCPPPSNRKVHNSHPCRISVSVPVPEVQALLDNPPPIKSRGKIDTAALANCEDSVLDTSNSLPLFREAVPLDCRGNYPALGTLLEGEGRRQLYEFLLGSCRVKLGDAGLVGVAIVKPKIGKGAQISATMVRSKTRTNRPAPESRRRSVTVGNSSTMATSAKFVTGDGKSGAPPCSSGPAIAPRDTVFSSSDGRGISANSDGMERAVKCLTAAGHSCPTPLSDASPTTDGNYYSQNDDGSSGSDEEDDGEQDNSTGRAVKTPTTTTARPSPVRPEATAVMQNILPNADVDGNENDDVNDDDESGGVTSDGENDHETEEDDDND